MPAPIDVAVIIVNYRSAALTLRALASLANERKKPELILQVVVVENASGDEAALREGMAAYADFAELLVSPTNGGFGAGNNLALRTLFGRAAAPLHPLPQPRHDCARRAVLQLTRFLEARPRWARPQPVRARRRHALAVAFRFPSPLGEFEGGACVGLLTRLLKRPRAAAPGSGAHRGRLALGCLDDVPARRARACRRFDEAYFLYFEETDLCLRTKAAAGRSVTAADRVMHVRGQSTGVTALDSKPSRCRATVSSRAPLLLQNHGLAYARRRACISRRQRHRHPAPHAGAAPGDAALAARLRSREPVVRA